jgi:hypothetical protein
VRPLRGLPELRQILCDNRSDGFDRFFENETIHRYDGESRVVGFEEQSVLRRYRCYQAL